jgi:hypothetical protein
VYRFGIIIDAIDDDWMDERAFQALVEQAVTISGGDRVPASRPAHRIALVPGMRRLLSALAGRTDAGDGA